MKVGKELNAQKQIPSTISEDSGFLNRICVTKAGALVFNLGIHTTEPRTSEGRRAGRVFPNQNLRASLNLRVADVVWH